MSGKRTATSAIGKGTLRRVKQHAKLPPLKKPKGKALERLVNTVEAYLARLDRGGVAFDCTTTAITLEHISLLKQVRDAVAPFSRYGDKIK